MDESFMQRLEALREDFGKPMPLSSAYRHPTHPIEARKAKPGSHSTGNAVDVLVSGADAHELLRLALAHGFTGIGVSQKGDHGSRFLHLDTLTEGARPTVWSY